MELAVPPGTAQFIRMDGHLEGHRLLSGEVMGRPGVLASILGVIGILLPLAYVGDTWRVGLGSSRLCDRYHLGGTYGPAGTMRGFDPKGVGPRSPDPGSSIGPRGGLKGDPLGADCRLSVTASLSAPVPIRLLSPYLRAGVFLDVGSLGNPFTSTTTTTTTTTIGAAAAAAAAGGAGATGAGGVVQMLADTRASAGVTLTAYLGSLKLVGSYALPLRVAQRDLARCWQIGISMVMD
jgi:outer membrane protein assembly factor BamA